jgi:endonuclease/exonuclease/phosphatase family metal-dependent hydrolase
MSRLCQTRRPAVPLLASLLILGLGCRPDPIAVSGPGAAQGGSQAAPAAGTARQRLKILTWNIWMMPSWTFQSPRNKKRARAIAAELLKLDFDILCLEKAFSRGARKVLAHALASRYPYRYGPANSRCSLKSNSGVWVLSRFPLSDYHEIRFRDCAGIECFSRKGALLLTGAFEGHRFQLLATHLTGESGPRSTPQRQKIRDRQMAQIQHELIEPHADPKAPLFLCGDFVTPRRDPADPSKESEGYRTMLRIFAARNGPEDRITFDDNRSRNDLAESNSGRTDELDYILVRPNGADLRMDWSRLILRHAGWDGRKHRQDLSYRYAVGVSVEFP